MIDRRTLMVSSLGALALPGCVAAPRATDLSTHFAAIEKLSGGRLGVALLDTATMQLSGNRLDERFTMCSTFKLPLAARILQGIAAGSLDAEQAIPIGSGDPVGHAPAVRAALERGESAMSLLDLARAAQVQSDNGAANILLRLLGGPHAFTAWLRGLGDATTRLDRYEPDLNLGPPGELRDTTTPRAFAATIAGLLTGPELPAAQQQRLMEWMTATQTGLKRLRAAFPANWSAGDKTGTAVVDDVANKANDVAFAQPPGGVLHVIAAYFESAATGAERLPTDDAVLARVGAEVARMIAGRAQI